VGSANLDYLVSDPLGSNTVAFNSTGQVIALQHYSPYGTGDYSWGTMPTTYNYATQRLDSQTGLLYDNFRYYDPLIGRYVRSDTVQDNATGMDPYAYVGDNPESKNDPTGHWGWDMQTVLTVAAVVAVVAVVIVVAVVAAPVVLAAAATAGEIAATTAAADGVVVAGAAATDAVTATAVDTATTAVVDTATTTVADTATATVDTTTTATTDTSTSLSTDTSNNPIYRFAQRSYSANFSQDGLMNGQPVSSVVSDLTNGNLSSQDLSVNYIVRSGIRLILNTRSAVTLISAGIPSTLWNTVDQTGDPFFQNLLTAQLTRNSLTDTGIEFVRGVLGIMHIQ